MTRTLLTLFLLMSALPVALPLLQAQAIPTIPDYPLGKRIDLLLKMQVEEIRDPDKSRAFTTPVSLRVVRKSTAGTTLDWYAEKSTYEDPRVASNPLVSMAEQIFEHLHFLVLLDPEGRYLGISNKQELENKIKEFVLLLIPQATSQFADPERRSQAGQVMRKVLTPPALLSAAMKEIDLFFGLSGLDLEKGQSRQIESSLLNPFGGAGSLTGHMQITPVDVDPSTGAATVEFRQEFGPASLAGLTEQMSSAAGNASPAPVAVPAMNLIDTGEYVLDLATGRVRTVRHVRRIQVDGETVRVETTEIGLQPEN